MAAYKDEERGTWYVSFYYEDWTGAKKRKVKRGFRTKKEALNFESEYKRTAKADMDMTMGEFVEVYFRDNPDSSLSIHLCDCLEYPKPLLCFPFPVNELPCNIQCPD